MFKKKRKEEQNGILISEGVRLRMDTWRQEENRLFTLILKGILVYLIVMGGIGSYLSSLDINYSWAVVHVVVLFGAVFCAALYYSTLWENLGYFLLLFFMLATGIVLRNYISSGFFAVANELGEQASVFFNSAAVRLFAEQVSNRYVAITVSMCYIGWSMCVLLNVLVSRRMQYVIVIPIVIGVLFFPLYIEQEPSPFYSAMLLTGLIGSYAIRGNGHYQITKNNHCYEYSPKKRKLSYVYSGKTIGGALLLLAVVILFFAGTFSVIVPRREYELSHQSSRMKMSTMDTVENFMMLGFMGLFNFYPNTGGLTSGRLGGVSSVRLDYEPDLTLEYVPYGSDRLYLKTFTGAVYLPYTNRWQRLSDDEGNTVQEETDPTAGQRKKDFEDGLENAARAHMKITNVAAATGVYLPYYSENNKEIVFPNRTVEYTFYPPVSRGSKVKQQVDINDWLDVPVENRVDIANLCEEAGLHPEQDRDEIIRKLYEFYVNEIPYTLRPGATPYGEDFINYFLSRNRKGYCAHFASSATLILRYLGIPARYIEGYAVDPVDIADEGKILTDRSYGDYYEGYNPLGADEVISVDASDANAHAWVEVYDKDLGWQVVELTPPSDGEGRARTSMLDSLMNLFRTTTDAAAPETATDIDNNSIINEQTGRISVIILGFVLGTVCLTLILLWLIRRVLERYAYARAGINDRVIMDYQRLVRRMGKKTPLRHLVNYRDQVGWLKEHSDTGLGDSETEEIIQILQQAGFSDREISDKQRETITDFLHKF